MMKPVAKEAKMNRGEAKEHKGGHEGPSAKRGGSEVGNETKSAVKYATDRQGPEDGLRGAINELKRQSGPDGPGPGAPKPKSKNEIGGRK